MSLFRKPKKTIQRRVFSACEDDSENGISNEEKMDVDPSPPPPPSFGVARKDKKKDRKNKQDPIQNKKSLLSFDDDEEEGEVFQVKKSSHSKKVMRMLDKERRKKKLKDYRPDNIDVENTSEPQQKSQNNNCTDSIQTEIRTDDFVLVVKKSEPDNVILNGRAAFCAGRDDMSSEDEGNASENVQNHKFSKPDTFKLVLESGRIPDAAMIHAARKRRQKAREQGDFIPVEDTTKESVKKGKRLVREDGDDDGSEDEERVDMNAITGSKEREERREKFYSVQNECSGDDSETEMHEWENQQIRKGVTGAQLVTAQQESVLSQFIIKAGSSYESNEPQSTASLLEQAYARSYLEKPRQILLGSSKPNAKPVGPRTPQEITDLLNQRLKKLLELNKQHTDDINRIMQDLRIAKDDALDCEQKAPVAAAKYRFYQELRGYITDLIECLDEKTPQINDLEKRTLNTLTKHATSLIERRRQDVRDQAKEVSDSTKPGSYKKGPDDEEHIRRQAEREGRRTRRRCEREKNNFSKSHLDGMSSDDEIPDHDLSQYRNSIDQLEVEADDLFEDTIEEYCRIEHILYKFEVWRKTDMESYKEAFVSLCLPKILGPLIRVKMMVWNPLDENFQDIEKMDWYATSMKYGYSPDETIESLTNDPDVRLVPSLIEKIVCPKLTELIENCWDPLSSSQTLRLVGLIGRLGREYPTLTESSKHITTLFNSILDKMKSSLENDVFIPIFPKQIQEAKTSFFQRQFCSGLKLFRNLLSWQGIIADRPLKDLAISSLLNRYLLSAMRVCSPTDAISKSYIIVNTLPSAWLQFESEHLDSFQQLISFIKHVTNQLEKKNPPYMDSYDKAKQILNRLHSSL